MNIIDYIAIAIIIISLISGMKRGFVKTTVSLIGLAASIILAVWLTVPVSGYIYNHMLTKPATTQSQTIQAPTQAEKQKSAGLIGALTDSNNTGKTVRQIITAYNAANGTNYDATKLPFGLSPDKPVPAIVTQLSGYSQDITAHADSLFTSGQGNLKTYQDAILKSIKDFLTAKLISFVVFVVILILTRLIFKLLGSMITAVVDKIPIIGGFNRLLGGVFGIAIGFLIVFVAMFALKYVASVTTDQHFNLLVTSSKSYQFTQSIDITALHLKNKA